MRRYRRYLCITSASDPMAKRYTPKSRGTINERIHGEEEPTAMLRPVYLQHGRTARRALAKLSFGGAWVLSMLFLLSVVMTGRAFGAKCLFVSSYHQGYAWSDGVERGV